jgi:hypothetical protein
MATKNDTGAVVATREPENPLAFLDNAKPLPELMVGRVDGLSWAKAIVLGEKYTEPNPDFLSRRMLQLKLNATDLFHTFEQNALQKLQQWVGDAPGSSTGPLMLQDVYVVPSSIEGGMPTFVIVDYTHMQTGESNTFSTGASNVQSFILKALVLGIWPVRCQIKRTDIMTKNGKYMLDVFPHDA